MWCLRMLPFFLCIVLRLVTSTAELIQVFGYEGREAKVPCPYEKGHESHEKYLCKNNCGSDDDVVIKTTQTNNSKFSIYDDKQKRVFTATISELHYSDTGKYWCGVTRSLTDFYNKVRLDVVKDSCCNQSTTVQSYEGGSVSISCSYQSEDQNNLKYICRGKQPSTCLQQALITSDRQQNRQFSLTDDKESRKFTVNVTSLTLKDSGSYLCGVHRNSSLDVFTAVDLEVKGNSCCNQSTTVQSYEGDSASISCSYQSEDQNNLKYICRGKQPSTCLQQALITSDRQQNRQFSLTDDKESRKFTVNVTSLTLKDSGLYLCGVHRNSRLDVFTAVDLEVKENSCCNQSSTVQSYEGGSASITCSYQSEDQNNLKYICRGNQPSTCLQQALITSDRQQNRQFSLTDDKESRKFTVNVTSLTLKDSGSYLCGVHRNNSLDVFTAVDLEVKDPAPHHPVVFIVPAVLLLILILSLAIVCKCKCQKVQGVGANMNRTTTKTVGEEKVTGEADIYENEDFVAYKKRRKSKQQSAVDQYVTEDQQESVYENFNSTEEIYCNDLYSAEQRAHL